LTCAMDVEALSTRLHDVTERIGQAARNSGRRPEDITLVAVTKGFPASVIEGALRVGLDHIGENRVQEAASKIPPFRRRATWHLVGHLQRNKVKKALELFDVIESLDSVRLAEEVQRRAEQTDRTVDVLVEVNTTGEPTKYGVAPDALHSFLEELRCFDRLRVEGLMTVGPLVQDPEDARPAFRRLRQLAEGYRDGYLRRLSMGMSGDFEVAVEEGATSVRIGTALFGPRPGA
jgi:pyridoxal phosphate enzyme (YggS family)